MTDYVKKYVDLIISIANDNKHGYSQKNRNGNPDFDCSSLVIYCVNKSGLPVALYGASYTGNMLKAFIKAGFKDVTKSINLVTGDGLVTGDILLTPYKHTEIYTGNGKITGARKDYDGKTGDSTGNEIVTHAYKNYPWKYVLRLSTNNAQNVDNANIPENLITDIIKGKYGNGNARKAKITALGYDYSVVRSLVNERLKKG